MSKVESPNPATESDVAEATSLQAEGQRKDLVLEVCDLRKSFTSPAGERIDVLRGVDFSIGAGQMIAVTGASGSGKSTLLQLLGGLDEVDHGTILLNGFAISRERGPALARFRQRNIGFVFQFHHLISELTATENVALPLLIGRNSARDARARANARLEALGLSQKRDHPIGHLSGGEQQRVAVARALIGDPILLLADEPTGNLDSAIGEEIAASLLNYSRSRRALVIVATHNQKLAQICDGILNIQNGRLHANGVEPSENCRSLQL